MGRGLLEPVDDWESGKISHPLLLEYLSRQLISHNYDLKHVARLILNSHAYQRVITDKSAKAAETASINNLYLFASPVRRRMSAEQLVDSLFAAAGKDFSSEELNMDIDGRRPITSFLNLGTPRSAWQSHPCPMSATAPPWPYPRRRVLWMCSAPSAGDNRGRIA